MVVSLLKKAQLEASPLDPQDFTTPLLYLDPLEPQVEEPLDKTCPDRVVKIGVTLFKEKQV